MRECSKVKLLSLCLLRSLHGCCSGARKAFAGRIWQFWRQAEKRDAVIERLDMSKTFRFMDMWGDHDKLIREMNDIGAWKDCVKHMFGNRDREIGAIGKQLFYIIEPLKAVKYLPFRI